ncbi:transcriptional regulator [Paenibacillus lycopersici]|uniref:Transcriptional regulator n=1 Tax=Paenibacillus lycopersici TaxID=2704462 RepID=A0A6C0FVR3_9BACL|nr:PLDc N-terminal domain-containing protein [Paenibacillus lycopersici]QHT60817.1 transcriptional regulator [Paenibacillus lycopersici]
MDVTTHQLLTIILPLAIIELVVIIAALVACVRAEQTRGPKWLWIIIIIAFNIIGSILFFLMGRKSS